MSDYFAKIISTLFYQLRRHLSVSFSLGVALRLRFASVVFW